MQNIKFILKSIILGYFLLLLVGCSDETKDVILTNDSFPLVTELYAENLDTHWRTITAQYDGETSKGLTDINIGVSILQYDLNEDGTITEAYTFTPTANDTSWNIDYTVEFLEDKITVSPIDLPMGTYIEIKATDGYIDEFFSYKGPNPDNGTLATFKRDAMNQIETISNFGIDMQSGTQVPTWELSFEAHLDYSFPAISNPVYAVGVNSLYNIHIIELLGLKVSSASPLTSTITALEGTTVVDKIEAEVASVTENGTLEQLNYVQQVFGIDNTRTVRFTY